MGQTNLIIWDDVNKIEHFVRDAQFTTPGKDLGFIAPVPTEPELGEVGGLVFRNLELFDPMRGRSKVLGSGGGFGGGLGGGVQVLQEKVVGGYRAAVLKADNGKALYEWLSLNGYRISETARPWLSYYVRKRWCFAAFKVEKKSEEKVVATGPVRLSFHSNKPYNPYYVPIDNVPDKPGPADRLAVYFVARGRFLGRVGGTDPWQGSVQWKVKLDDRARASIARDVNLATDAILPGSNLTKYVDSVFPRNVRDDVFFDQVFP